MRDAPDALLLDVLDALLRVQTAADRLLVRLQARAVERSGVFRVVEIDHSLPETDQTRGPAST